MHLGPTGTGKHPQYNRDYSSSVLKVDADLGWMKESAGSKGGMVNPNFIYPGPFYTVAAKANKAGRGKTMVQRGYIRKLTETVYDGELLGKSYCKFQFNPDVIQRGVQARNDIQYWFNQDAAQMSQPIPGDASFGFVLLFNREAEVNSKMFLSGEVLTKGKSWEPPKSIEDVGEMISGKWRKSLGEKITDISGRFDQAQVTDLGVLIDLMVLDDITGQSISQAAIDAIKSRNTKVAADAKAKAEAAGPLTPEEEEKAAEEAKKDGAKSVTVVTDKTLDANIGNTAFLLAQPVRVVFTEWFMVEGYISSINVTFNKFSPDMIPTQCVVDIQMQALYMGFARKDTYLTKIAEQVNETLVSGTSGKNSPLEEPTSTFTRKQLDSPGMELVKQSADFWANQAVYKGAEVSLFRRAGTTSPDAELGNIIFVGKQEFQIALVVYLNEVNEALKGIVTLHDGGMLKGELKLRMHWDSYQAGAARSAGNGLPYYEGNQLVAGEGTLTSGYPGSILASGITTNMDEIWGDNRVKGGQIELEGTFRSSSFGQTGQEDNLTMIWNVAPTARYEEKNILRPFTNDKFVVSGECTLSIPLKTSGATNPIAVGRCEFSKSFFLSEYNRIIIPTGWIAAKRAT